MNWLKKIFGRKKKGQSSDTSQSKDPVPFQSDEFFDANEGILEGATFAPPLSLSTSLDALEHYGELFRGRPNDAPTYGGHHFWLPKVKDEYSFFSESMPASSEIGPIKPDLYAPHLISFRRIIETNLSIDEKRKKFSEAITNDVNFARVWGQWESLVLDFPDFFLGLGEISEIPGVGRKTARVIFYAGYTSKISLSKASAKDLEALPGIGQKTANRILGWLQSHLK